MRRNFIHDKGGAYHLECDGCRVYEGWSEEGKKTGQSTTVMCEDAAEANAHAVKKVKQLLKKGYVEVEPSEGRKVDRYADVVEAYRRNLRYDGTPSEPFVAVPETAHLFAYETVGFAAWLVTSDDRTRGVSWRSSILHNRLPKAQWQLIASAVQALVLEKREEILADAKTPVRIYPLEAGPFDRLFVLSPEVENSQVAGGLIRHSLWYAFPGYACEMSGTESAKLADARCAGHASIPQAKWDREPHAVLDLAHLKKAGEAPTFLVYPPDRMEYMLGEKALGQLTKAEVLARNYKGDVRRFVKGDTPDLAELRAFFGFPA